MEKINPVTRRVAKRRKKVKEILIAEAGGKCFDCGGVFPPFVYDFDHREPSEKSFAISRVGTCSIDKIRTEISKCDLVCANCHRLRTHKQRCDGCKYCVDSAEYIQEAEGWPHKPVCVGAIPTSATK